jgi:mono/diheme cytochrome c family protein
MNAKPTGGKLTLLTQICAIVIFAVVSACSTNTTNKVVVDDQQESYNILQASHARPLTDVKYEATDERIARGKYLMEGPLWCFQCHTERDKSKPGSPPLWDKKGSGAELFKTDSTHLYAPNITPDKRTGIGNFTDDMIARAIREGVGHDGRALTVMPWWTFRELTDEDIASIVSYLRSIPAIEHKLPRRNLTLKEEQELKEGSVPLTSPLEELDNSSMIGRGSYLIRASDCVGCHTGWYGRNPGMYGGGNPMNHNKEHVFSPNITSDSTGIGAWSAETFIYVMRNGKGKSGTIGGMMPWTSFKNMSDEDLTAIYLALMSTYPVRHIVQNGVPPTPCEVCKLEHGLGDKNKIRPMQVFKGKYEIPADAVGNYVSQSMERDTVRVAVDKKALVFVGFGSSVTLAPISATQYFAEGFFAPIQFTKDAAGSVTGFQLNDLGRNFKKVRMAVANK